MLYGEVIRQLKDEMRKKGKKKVRGERNNHLPRGIYFIDDNGKVKVG